MPGTEPRGPKQIYKALHLVDEGPARVADTKRRSASRSICPSSSFRSASGSATGRRESDPCGSLILVLSAELLNSAIEAIGDKASPEFHELAGRAKDMGSAAVFVLMINVMLCWGLILWPRLYGALAGQRRGAWNSSNPQLARPAHAVHARDRPRRRQSRVHLDRGRQPAAETSGRGAPLGLGFACITRILLLLLLAHWRAWTTRTRLFPWSARSSSIRDLVLSGGGMFLIVKGIMEILDRSAASRRKQRDNRRAASFRHGHRADRDDRHRVLARSVITAVGMVATSGHGRCDRARGAVMIFAADPIGDSSTATRRSRCSRSRSSC